MGLFLFVLISIFFLFLYSVSGAVFLSATLLFINVKKQERKAYAFTFKKGKQDIDAPLITILTISTVSHILVGVKTQNILPS